MPLVTERLGFDSRQRRYKFLFSYCRTSLGHTWWVISPVGRSPNVELHLVPSLRIHIHEWYSHTGRTLRYVWEKVAELLRYCLKVMFRRHSLAMEYNISINFSQHAVWRWQCACYTVSWFPVSCVFACTGSRQVCFPALCVVSMNCCASPLTITRTFALVVYSLRHSKQVASISELSSLN